MADKEGMVKEALARLLNSHLSSGNVLQSIDEVVLSYLSSILEELDSDSQPQALADEAFDVEQFCEMMAAFIPGFEQIDSAQVCEWMFDLASQLSGSHKQESRNSTTLGHDAPDLGHNDTLPHAVGKEGEGCRPKCPSTREHHDSTSSKCRTISTSSERSVDSVDTVDGEEGANGEDSLMSEEIERLTEMFPETCSLEMTHCLGVAGGDLDHAAQLILHRADTGERIVSNHKHKTRKKKSKTGSGPAEVDQEIKEQIISRYSYVDTAEDTITHKPVAPKSDDRKMIRYLDGRVVSTKGERFKDVKKDEDEKMKKTYINLKPAKQYRFH